MRISYRNYLLRATLDIRELEAGSAKFRAKNNQSKQFCHLRYQVQEIQSPFREQLQKDISDLLKALHRLTRFDAKTIHK
jgi:hypothetical protein